jgi:hypothetical protein
MVMRGLRVLIALGIGFALAGDAKAGAQTPSRPYRGLFGGGVPSPYRGQMVDLSTSAFVGWDQPQDVVATPLGTSNDRTLVSGPFAGGSAQLDYTHPGDRFSFRGSGSAFTSYFSNNDEDPWYSSYAGFGDLGWRIDLSRRTHIRLNESVYSSTDYNSRSTFLSSPSPIPPPTASEGFETALVHAPSLSSNSLIDLGQDFSTKSSMSVYYGYRVIHYFSDELLLHDTYTNSAGARYQHHITKNIGYHVGAGYQHHSSSGDQPPTTFYNIDAGIDYGRAISLTRTTTFQFAVGTTIAAGQAAGSDDPPFGNQRLYVVGNADLTQELGRSWLLNTYYRRQINYDTGLGQPSLYDIAGTQVSGLLSHRVDLAGSVNYQTARIGLENSNHDSWFATGQVRSAITRNLAAYASYYYALSDFDADVVLPPGVPRHIDRQGVRVGVTAWLPLWYGRGAP